MAAAPPKERLVFPERAVDEEVNIVDERGEVVRHASRRVMRAENLRHQATFIFALDGEGRLLVQKRTMLKDFCPGFYDPCSGGVLQRGETFAPSARRELEEEMGISGVPLRHCGSFLYEDDAARVWGDMWDCQYEGELTLQAEEVESVERWTAAECLAKAESGEARFTPDGIYALRRYLAFVEANGPPPRASS
jgi:8-oxo-dGTP pyrophosphatase MutT (NUDIX family)